MQSIKFQINFITLKSHNIAIGDSFRSGRFMCLKLNASKSIAACAEFHWAGQLKRPNNRVTRRTCSVKQRLRLFHMRQSVRSRI
jgi:hypothetical protein